MRQKRGEQYEIIQSRNGIATDLLFLLFGGCDMYAFIYCILYYNNWKNMF